MTDEFKQVFFTVCLMFYCLVIGIVKTSSATFSDGFITALIFTVIAVIAYKLSNKP